MEIIPKNGPGKCTQSVGVPRTFVQDYEIAVYECITRRGEDVRKPQQDQNEKKTGGQNPPVFFEIQWFMPYPS